MKNTLFILTIFFFLIGCDSPQRIKTDREKMNLKNDVVLVIEESEGIDEVTLFNEDGMIIYNINYQQSIGLIRLPIDSQINLTKSTPGIPAGNPG